MFLSGYTKWTLIPLSLVFPGRRYFSLFIVTIEGMHLQLLAWCNVQIKKKDLRFIWFPTSLLISSRFISQPHLWLENWTAYVFDHSWYQRIVSTIAMVLKITIFSINALLFIANPIAATKFKQYRVTTCTIVTTTLMCCRYKVDFIFILY